MNEKHSILTLVCKIKKLIQTNNLSTEKIINATEDLTALGFKGYDDNKFPALKNMENLSEHVKCSPANLAEALIWKLGKWNTYKEFVKNYNDKNFIVSNNGGVVFSAFAKHLQNNENPIYDQHTIRALWTVTSFSEKETALCKKLLFTTNDKWKDVGSGDDGSCYKIFVNHMNLICEKNQIGNKLLDRLLMPLGQALKAHTKKTNEASKDVTDYQRFSRFLIAMGPTQS